MCNLQVIEEEGTQQKALDLGTYMMLELAKLRDEVEIVGDVRGKGLMIGIEMVEDKVRQECWASIFLTRWPERPGKRFYYWCLKIRQ